MSYQLPPKVINTKSEPMRYHAMDPLDLGERNVADERAIEDLMFKRVEPGTNVFLKYDRSSNEFEYITGDHWDSCHRFVGTVLEARSLRRSES